jgi:hypothetical protein
MYELPESTSTSSYSTTNFDTIASLDKDQQIMLAQLASETDESIALAKQVFMEGAFSDPYAVLTFENDVGFPSMFNIPAGTSVQGQTIEGSTLYTTTTIDSVFGDDTLAVHYTKDGNSECSVGGNPSPITGGCKFLFLLYDIM